MKISIRQQSRILDEAIRFNLVAPNSENSSKLWKWTESLTKETACEIIGQIIKTQTKEEIEFIFKLYNFK